MSWLKRYSWLWPLVALALSIVSLAFSIFAICETRHEYRETTRPHTQFEESWKNLEMLDAKLDKTEKWVGEHRKLGTDVTEWEANLQQARILREDAEEQIMGSDYVEADRLIKEAYDLTGTVPRPPRGEGGACGCISETKTSASELSIGWGITGFCGVAGYYFLRKVSRHRNTKS